MKEFKRVLRLALPARQSAFLWGARKTGKTTFLRQKFPGSRFYDLLDTDLFMALIKRPALLREQLMARPPARRQPVIIDEVQKVPALLDEVHWLIENRGYRFVLCGSSARKLKRGQANLLGGRAWRYAMHPLVSVEIGRELDLLRVLNQGMIPLHYRQTAEQSQRSLQAYVLDYLKEEVFAEGLVRKMPAFSRFFDAMGYSHGELLNYANIGRDCGVDCKTVKEYFQILVDTMSGTIIEPFRRRPGREPISKAGKFYLFDVGVAGTITRRHIAEARGEQFGRAFEHFILTELIAYRSYSGKDFPVNFWRTKTGLEVDFVLGDGAVAVEVKGAHQLGPADFRGLNAFIEDHSPRRAVIVSTEPTARKVGGVRVMPWREFLDELWGGKLI